MAVNRAYSLWHVKAVDEETRVITGTATTPEPDRSGDIIEPLGASFTNPLPLLMYHRADQPVGQVTLKKPTKDGIEFKAQLPAIDEPGKLKDRVDEAWQSIKAGLLAGVSIGFRAIEMAFMKDGGIHFLETEILELSLVTVPANANATIASIKSLDLAASGRHLPGASGTTIVRAMPRATKSSPMTIAEQITQYSNTRAARQARMDEIMAKSAAENITLDAAQIEEYDGLSAEVKAIDGHLVRLRDHEKSVAAGATAIQPATNQEQASAQRGGTPIIQVKSQLPKGTAFVRYFQACAYGHGDSMRTLAFAQQWKDSTPEVELAIKAAIAPGTTTDATWAGPLVQLTPMFSEFLELLRPATILGRIPGLRKVPFNISVPTQTGGSTFAWVQQGAPKPVSKLAFGTTTLGFAKAAGIVVITQELARFSSPSAEDTIRDDMIAGMAAFLDLEFTDPAKAPVANVSPGSITNGVTPITSAGTSPANARTDINALLSAIAAAGLPISNVVLVMSEANALALSSALNPLGAPLFPNMRVDGGTGPNGVTVIASQAVGNNVIALVPNAILLADDGGVNIDVSTEASVQMDSAPDNPALATTVLTSFWQNNLVGLRAERFINWKRARTGAVQYTVATYTT